MTFPFVVAQGPYAGARGGVCQDCKHPNYSTVAILCSCILGPGSYDWDAHHKALEEAGALRLQGVPFSDPRYYPDTADAAGESTS